MEKTAAKYISGHGLAIEGARVEKHDQVTTDDLINAKSQFSDSRLKELGDEYAENYPQIQLILRRFFGLGDRFTIAGIQDFIKALLVDDMIKAGCGAWIYNYTNLVRFIELLYSIGFFGLDNGKGVLFRSPGVRAGDVPPIDNKTQLMIHPMFTDALQLRDVLITSIAEDGLRESGILLDLPGRLDPQEYTIAIEKLKEDLETLPTGEDSSTGFEDVVGEIIRLCFHQVLANPQPQERDIDGRIRRDWVASIAAISGFWQKMEMRYRATQVIWECKKYEKLESKDFQQIGSYLTSPLENLELSHSGER